MLTFAQYLEESSLNSDQIIKNPSLMKIGLYADKGFLLRYFKHEKDIYIGNAYYMQHGEIADNIGCGRDYWRYEALTGFIYPDDFGNIKAKGLKEWVIARHAKAKGNNWQGKYIPERDWNYDEEGEDSGIDSVHVSAHMRSHSKVHAYSRARPQMSMSLRGK